MLGDVLGKTPIGRNTENRYFRKCALGNVIGDVLDDVLGNVLGEVLGDVLGTWRGDGTHKRFALCSLWKRC